MQWTFVFLSLLLFSPFSFAGDCKSKFPPAHVEFCNGKTQQECQAHNGVCSWKDAVEKVARVVVEEKCQAQDGKEAHEGFCSGHNKQVCKVHSNLCLWK